MSLKDYFFFFYFLKYVKIKLHIKYQGYKIDDKEKVIVLYNYIAEVSKSFKDTKINFTEEKWFSFFDDFPKH